jgi:carbamoyl-phosphate synthase large subunit
VACETVPKVNEGQPNVVERIERGEVDLVINTPLGRESQYDEKAIRVAAVARGVTCVTTLQGAAAAVAGIAARRRGAPAVRALQDDAAAAPDGDART